jgi:hypothetical protein
MHNRKRSGQGLGYVLAALMVVSCGGGGGSSLSLSGKSDNTLGFVTDTSVAVPVPYKGGVAALVLSVKDKSGAGIPNQPVTLTITGPGRLLTSTGVTSAVAGQVGNVTFQIIGGDTEGDGTVTASYTDAAGNQTDPVVMKYTVVNPSNAPSVYTIATPKLLDANGNEISGNLLLPTSGNSNATIKISVKDTSGKTTNQGRLQLAFPTDGETGKGQLSTTSPSFVIERDSLGNPVLDANGDIVYSASVILDAAAQTVGDNRVVVTYTDTLGSRTTTSIPFSIINQFNVLLTADKTQVKTGGDSLKLSATVVDGASGRVKDQSVSFRIADGMPLSQAPCPATSVGIGDSSQFVASRALQTSNKGDLLPSTAKTDVNGVASAIFSVNDWRNSSRRIYAVVEAGSGSAKPVACFDVKLTGTSIVLSPEVVNTASGAAFPVTATVKDGLGNAVPNVAVELSGAGVSASKSARTGTSGITRGIATFSMAPSVVGGDVIASSPSQAVSEENADAAPLNAVSVGVSFRNIAVTVLDATPKPVSEDLALDTNYTVNIKADNAGVPLTGTVIASTSLGALTLPSPATLVGGELNAVLRSSEPGTAYVNVRILDGSNKVTLLSNEAVSFAALVPAKITALAGRTTLDRLESTEIVARVLDKNDYPVKGQWVQFNVTGDTSGGGFTNGTALAQTNQEGIAVVSYTAGDTDTAKDNIRITAGMFEAAYSAVKVKEPVYLTVSGSPVSVTLAAGNKIVALDDTTYSFPYQVMVTNAAGGPVANQEVVLTVIPTYYLKGFYYYNSVAKAWLPKAIDRTTLKAMTFGYIVSGADTASEMPPIACPNEDVNQNGILDPLEDTNGDNKLWPGNPVTVSSKVVKTNASGYVNFDVIYGKSYANWLQVKLIASTRVSGSEATSESEFSLPALAADMGNESVSPPGGLRSAFGQSLVAISYTPDTSTPPVYEPTSVAITTGASACRLKLNEGGIYTIGLP